MQKAERFQRILAQLRSDKRVDVAQLSRELGVSVDTVRRDLVELERRGHLVKVHGGAISRTLLPTDLEDRLVYQREAKAELAQRALPLIEPGQTILMDGGSTNLELARLLPAYPELTLFTNSLPLAELLARHPTVQLQFLGGTLHKPARTTVGVAVTEAVRRIRADLYFMGVAAVHAQYGLTVPHLAEAEVKRAMHRSAERTVSLILKDKVEAVETYHVADVGDLAVVIYEE